MWSKTLVKTKNYTLMLYGKTKPFRWHDWLDKRWRNLRSRLLSYFPPSEQVRKYGTNSLAVWDDRKRGEKFNDWVNSIFSYAKVKWARNNHGWAKLYNFISYFDTSNGVKITNHEQEKIFEAEGQTKMTFDEAQRTAKRYKKQKQKDNLEKLEKVIDKNLYGLAQGKYRSTRNIRFSQENLQKVLEAQND